MGVEQVGATLAGLRQATGSEHYDEQTEERYEH